MAQQTPNQPNQQEPFIPPQYLLILSGLAFIVAVFIALTQPEFGVVGFGALAFCILALLMWVLLAPKTARAVLTGRTARFGGTSLVVTILLLIVLVGVYAVVRNQKWSVDLTQDNSFSLSDESRKAIAAIGADPNAPKVHMIAFFGPSQAGQRDQMTLLFDDYEKTSNNKIDYEFIDPDRQPQTASLYKVTTAGSIAIAKIDPATGQPNTTNAQIATATDQGTITNDILKVSSSGVFNAYFLNVADGTAAQMTNLKSNLTQRYGWTVKDVTLEQLTSPSGGINLDDPNVTGQVIIIPGGSAALSDAELKVIEDYISKGSTSAAYHGLVILAGTNLNDKKTSLATDPNLNTWLTQNFGVNFNADVVLDKTQAFQSPLFPVSTDLDTGSFITSNGIPGGQGAVIFEVPNSITVAATAPANVTVNAIMHTTSAAYAKTNLQDVLDNKIDKADGDAGGPFVLAASAENTQTHARVVLLGSTSLGLDQYASPNIDNLNVAFNSLIWTTNFNNYFTQITVQQQQRPQDQPIFADDQTTRNINLITLVILPFGVLLIGILVWWTNRERAR